LNACDRRVIAVSIGGYDTSAALYSIRLSFCQLFKKQADPLARINASLDGGGTYRFLRIRDVGTERRALFRMVNADDGLNYHDLVLLKTSSGAVRAVDIDVLMLEDNSLPT